MISDINDNSFDMADNVMVNKWKHRTPLLMNECQDCIAIALCGAGCGKHSEDVTGSFNNPDFRVCDENTMLLNWAIDKEYSNYLQE